MGIRESQKQATRSKVICAARDLFQEIGYDETTIRAIAERAGVSVGSVFTTFSSKASILSQVMADRVEALSGELERVYPHLRGTTADRLSSIFAIHYDFECRRVRLFLAHIAASFSLQRDEDTIPFGHNDRFKGMIVRVLQEGIARGDVAADLDLRLALDTLLAAYSWNYRLAAAEGHEAAQMAAIMERQITLIIEGARPREAPAQAVRTG